MKTKQVSVKIQAGNDGALQEAFAAGPQLALVFGDVAILGDEGFRGRLAKAAGPGCHVVGCSTAGEISNGGVSDGTAVITTVKFERTEVSMATARLRSTADSATAGHDLGRQLKRSGLKAVIVFAKGLDINGSALVKGLEEELGPKVLVTGGLAGDAVRFEKTLVLKEGAAVSDEVVAIGLCGENTKVSFGTRGGWMPFGPVRRVTRAEGNMLYELDHKPALAIYKEYLGDHSKNLPGSALLFPLAILKNDRDESGLIRTILGVNEADQSLTFAGDIPSQGLVRLMHAPADAIVDGARGAAENVGSVDKDGLALLISCVGRKLVLGSDIEEEVEAVKEVLGSAATFAGFYSYGEICPQERGGFCKLHNQTMTITYISEEKKAA